MLLERDDLAVLAGEKSADKIWSYVKARVWRWYDLHKDDEIASYKLLRIISITIRVRDVRRLFVLLVGEPA